MMRLLVLQKMGDKIKEKFNRTLEPYFEIDFAGSFDKAYLEQKIQGVDICFGSFLPDSVVESADRLKALQLAGTGVDKLNLQLIAKKGVAVYKTQTQSKYVAEFAIAMMYSLVKKIGYFDRLLRSHDTKTLRTLAGVDYNSQTLFSKTIGIVGYGHIGKWIHKFLQPYDAHVLINSATPKSNDELSGGTYTGFKELVQKCDVIFICCPLTPKTKRMVGVSEFKSARENSIWINISRGAIIDFEAIIYALENKCIGGIAIDNWYPEVEDAERRLSSFDNVILSPYRAINITDEQPNISDAMHNLLRLGKGERMQHSVDFKKGY